MVSCDCAAEPASRRNSELRGSLSDFRVAPNLDTLPNPVSGDISAFGEGESVFCDQVLLDRVITVCRKDWHSPAIGALVSSDLGAMGAPVPFAA